MNTTNTATTTTTTTAARYSPLRKERIGLIDGDIILYACGYIADKEEACEAGARTIVDNMLLNIKHTLDLRSARIFFSDTASNNFRYKVATTHPYKGNRKDRTKPTHHEMLRAYMLDYWEGEVAKKMEADDWLGKHQKIKSTIICTIDKDLDMIPGWHYNWKHYRIYTVSRWEAQLFFWTQMLTGDNTDNIKGIYRVGPVKAAKILAEVTCEMGLYARVVGAYCAEFGDSARDRFNENYDLLMIKGAPVHFRDEPEYPLKEIAGNTEHRA